MIDKSNSKIYKYIVFGSIILTCIIVMLLTTLKEFGEIDSIRSNQLEELYQIAGSTSDNDTYYAITDILKGKKDEDSIELGRQLLSEQGFTDSYVNNYVTIGNDNKNNILILNIVIAFIFIIGISIMVFYTKSNHKRELNSILEVLKRFTKGDYNFLAPITDESIGSKIKYDLESLGKTITITNARLQEEKEGTKALVTDISHQLKTPLASLKMYYSLMVEDGLEEKERQEFVERSKEQITRLEGLVAALVNISRLETGLINIKTKMNDIRETLIQAVNSVYMKAEEKEIKIDLHKIQPVELPYDDKWTKEAISNVIDNAIKYSDRNSTITIRTQKLHNYLRIEIEDEGIGVNEKEYTDLFKRFYRGKRDIVKKQEGSGVGLYLTRKILEDQGGNIKAISKSSMGVNNRGSIFVLQLLLE
ncbi:sensor histidine kinase [Vallitalea guaymasensis]|uniref:sensor histidine kinase n=1 Tax=Vallitalea guaymasensis TaxID=1185412 RepID=UPI0023521BDE|nr:HAMP domain-containing sensor histidine kinase [Vallitalea guaymasensis]